MITDWLLNKIRDAIYDGATTIGSDISHIAVGTGSTGESGGLIELDTGYCRKAIENIEVGDRSISVLAVLDTTEGNTTIKEVGAFDASSGGNMWLRELINIQAEKTSDVEMEIDIVISLSSDS